ncbi:MAG: hypothetical protein BJ554DRAFT_826 [Olpidium bornovanus]|uniref:Uncharacterized protein n=1 Tax=Olpidium bornovanus TaxID=278681 RepID=A0A8H7ZTD0_9FUNG|nr:MAG: hypothetical protein BJ554DRAFT_826 [Olpidium bornovanus]
MMLVQFWFGVSHVGVQALALPIATGYPVTAAAILKRLRTPIPFKRSLSFRGGCSPCALLRALALSFAGALLALSFARGRSTSRALSFARRPPSQTLALGLFLAERGKLGWRREGRGGLRQEETFTGRARVVFSTLPLAPLNYQADVLHDLLLAVKWAVNHYNADLSTAALDILGPLMVKVQRKAPGMLNPHVILQLFRPVIDHLTDVGRSCCREFFL